MTYKVVETFKGCVNHNPVVNVQIRSLVLALVTRGFKRVFRNRKIHVPHSRCIMMFVYLYAPASPGQNWSLIRKDSIETGRPNGPELLENIKDKSDSEFVTPPYLLITCNVGMSSTINEPDNPGAYIRKLILKKVSRSRAGIKSLSYLN